MIIGAAFALLLIAASFFLPKLKPSPALAPPNDSVSGTSQNAPTENIPIEVAVDTSGWKTYRDPVYHFLIKYPEGWASPEAKKITDPDFDYEYQVLFGTADTLSGENFEGFSVYVFQTGKCAVSAGQANGQDGSSGCATKISSSALETPNREKILEFSSIAYTYTLVPYIAPDGVDSNLVKKVNREFDEAGKTFQYDSSLKVPAPPKPVVSKSAPPAVPPKPAPAVGRRGKLTGAVSKGGKLVCPHPNRKPMRSPNKGNHVDEDCCPDPDEWPNIACAYKPSDYKIMLKP